MKVYTFSEARQQLASVLDYARADGAVQVTRRGGQVYTITPLKSVATSPLNVRGVTLKKRPLVTAKDIVDAVREGRDDRYA